MELEHITNEICPTCGSHPVAETKDHLHTNGNWNESRKFSCGAVIEYSPNFRRVSTRTQCPKHPDEVAKKDKRESAKKKLQNYINKLACDDEYKRRLLSSVEYV